MALDAGLYVAATPIGNLKDVTIRVVEALKEADLILCEDTRHTARLCAAYGIKTPRAPYHDHNADKVRPDILRQLQEGRAICLVSDAGTPLISDPGFKLVREARALGVAVHPLPGACAAVAALSAAGAPTDRFVFAGFPPPRQSARDAFLRELAGIGATLVFYETGPRLSGSLSSMAAIFGPRRCTVAREITKLHEEFRSGALADLASAYADAPPRGEIVVIVHPPENAAPAAEDIDAFIANALAQMSVKDAAEAAANALGVARKDAYERALRLKAGS